MASWAPSVRRERSLTDACRTQRHDRTAGRTGLRVRFYSRERSNVGAGLLQAREDFAGTIACWLDHRGGRGVPRSTNEIRLGDLALRAPDTIHLLLEPLDSGTELTLVVDAELHGVYKLMGPLMKWVVQRQFKTQLHT